MATTAEEVWQLLGELIQSQQETDRRFQEQSQESDRRFRETERLIKEQNQRVELGKLGNRLGEFVEWQVRPAAVRLFQERGIDVTELSSDLSVKKGDDGLEIDLLVVSGSEAIEIEVKSKLTQTDVGKHLERLDKLKKLLMRYQSLTVFGAVAAMVIPSEAAR